VTSKVSKLKWRWNEAQRSRKVAWFKCEPTAGLMFGGLPQAMAILGARDANIGVIGGMEEFGIFLDHYDIFYPLWSNSGRDDV
jgi:hypothetical protein